MKYISKKKMKEFNKSVFELIKQHGAVECDDYRQYKIECEELGNYHVSLDYDGSCIYSIFGVFEDIDEARDFLRMAGGNIYSGKLNYHSTDHDECIRGLETMLNRWSMASLKNIT